MLLLFFPNSLTPGTYGARTDAYTLELLSRQILLAGALRILSQLSELLEQSGLTEGDREQQAQDFSSFTFISPVWTELLAALTSIGNPNGDVITIGYHDHGNDID